MPIVIVSMNFGWDHLCGCCTFDEDLSLFRFFVLGELDDFAASCDSPAVGILGWSLLPPFRGQVLDLAVCWEEGGAGFPWATLLVHICFKEGNSDLEGFSDGIVTCSL